uniref:PWWP domain-containing protein n=1 Tax=Oryza brachyantha TaxID=4533 RepID=J3M3J4_ORYBR
MEVVGFMFWAKFKAADASENSAGGGEKVALVAADRMASPEKGAVTKNGGEGEVETVMRRPGRVRVVHPDVAEFLSSFRHLRTKKPKPATTTTTPPTAGERARYGCEFEDEGEEGRRGGFAPGRLVWGKVKGHPWWPGQVFDPADASELALELPRKRGATLVAFFWDKTFAGAFRGEAFAGYISALPLAPLAGADRLDLAIARAQMEALDRWRGAARPVPEYTSHDGIEAKAMVAAPARRRKRGRPRKNSTSDNVEDDALELDSFEPTPQPRSHQMSTKIGKLMSRAAQQMSQSPAASHRGTDGQAPPPAMSLSMARCTMPADESPPLKEKNGDLKDDPLLAGLVLNFICPSAVLPLGDLVKIFSQFGPIMEAKTENSYALVMFKRRSDAEAAFSGTANIGVLSSSLISFRLNYSMSASPIDLPESTLNTDKDHLFFENVQ